MTFLALSLATLDTALPTGTGWTFESKLDGYRIEAVIDHAATTAVTLYSRSAKDWTHRFPLVAEALRALPVDDAVVDGEIVVPVSRGQSAFQALQRSLEMDAVTGVHYVLFDLLRLDGTDLRPLSLRDRQSLLRSLLRHRTPNSPLKPVRKFAARGHDVLQRACAIGLEGVVCKRLDGRYLAGRHRGWLKVKCAARQEFVVLGFTEPRGQRIGFGALLLGVYDERGALRFAGKVGTGFDTSALASLHRRLRSLQTEQASVSGIREVSTRDVHWVRPELVAEVSFTEWTDEGRLRHPVFHGLRDDKSPRAVVREQPREAYEHAH